MRVSYINDKVQIPYIKNFEVSNMGNCNKDVIERLFFEQVKKLTLNTKVSFFDLQFINSCRRLGVA